MLWFLFTSAEYPFINYFVIHKNSQETRCLFRDLRTATYDEFCPNKTGYACQHSIDLYDEVATIARPPVEPLSKRPMTDLTGYIVCIYRVFKGDDGEKFERNWLYWTGKWFLLQPIKYLLKFERAFQTILKAKLSIIIEKCCNAKMHQNCLY